MLKSFKCWPLPSRSTNAAAKPTLCADQRSARTKQHLKPNLHVTGKYSTSTLETNQANATTSHPPPWPATRPPPKMQPPLPPGLPNTAAYAPTHCVHLPSRLTPPQATVEDLDPPPALSTHPSTPLHSALITAFERDYTHLTVLDPSTKALLGYISTPALREKLSKREIAEHDHVEKAMVKFRRKGKAYKVITMETALEELEAFFEGAVTGRKEDFAVVTDAGRRFVLGVATRGDLEEFVRRRPA